MITLITGLPGNGKTLYALTLIKAYAEKENREVFYSGIKDLRLPWTEIKAEEWFNQPAGAIIVIDECQFVFPKKPNGAKLPDHYEKLAIHRHSGYDIFLITQDPALVDLFVRKLSGRHFHVVRKFGMARATIYEWSSVNTSPLSAASQKSAIPLKWAYPKSSYEYYKSAEVHTVKRAIPAKLILACLFVVAVLGCGWYVLDRFQARTKKPDAVQSGAVGVASPGQASDAVRPFDPVADAKQFIAMSTPRVVGLPHTSPKYDELTKPTNVPVPAACIQYGPQGSKCKCMTQQATPLDVPFNMCISFAREGFFEEFDRDKDKQMTARAAESMQVLGGRPEAALPSNSASGSVVSFGNPPRDPPHIPAVGKSG
jgi:zona occludens toxin